MARDREIQGTRSLARIFKTLTTLTHDSKYPLCNSELCRETAFADHITNVHLRRPLADLLTLLYTSNDQLFFSGIRTEMLVRLL